jgi:hypothetical protein
VVEKDRLARRVRKGRSGGGDMRRVGGEQRYICF